MDEKYGAFSILCTAKSLSRMKTEIRLDNMLEVYYPLSIVLDGSSECDAHVLSGTGNLIC